MSEIDFTIKVHRDVPELIERMKFTPEEVTLERLATINKIASEEEMKWEVYSGDLFEGVVVKSHFCHLYFRDQDTDEPVHIFMLLDNGLEYVFEGGSWGDRRAWFPEEGFDEKYGQYSPFLTDVVEELESAGVIYN